MTDATLHDDLQLRALRGQEPTLEQFLHFLGRGRQEDALHPAITAVRDPETQLHVACNWLGSRKQGRAPEPGHQLSADEYEIFTAACLSLRLLHSAQLQASHPVEAEYEALAPIFLNLGIDDTPAIRNAAARLGLPDETVEELRGLMWLSEPGPRPAADTPRCGWWHLRIQTHLACNGLDNTQEPATELTWLTTGHEDARLTVMLNDWEALSRPLGETDPFSSVWMPEPSHVRAAEPTKLEAMARQARMIMEALDTLNPDASDSGTSDSVAAQERSGLLQTLSRLNVPHRSRREGSSGALLNLWLMARLPGHWEALLPPVTEDQAAARQPEFALLRLLSPEQASGAGTWGGALARLRENMNKNTTPPPESDA